ncbi:hypothetical protein NPIL_569971 [Nephila pilipes]|uniref:Uncharacterized protein n=1 Tax=Nephila pilipes TaxID=299642 RepID=A0A8X6Q2I7_NEPPI|nr:hypothetical protein NPIL_569971 [Nephila pilipes]
MLFPSLRAFDDANSFQPKGSSSRIELPPTKGYLPLCKTKIKLRTKYGTVMAPEPIEAYRINSIYTICRNAAHTAYKLRGRFRYSCRPNSEFGEDSDN